LESQLLRRLRQDDCLSPGAEDQPRYHSEMLEREREREKETEEKNVNTFLRNTSVLLL
jgi:hypothetical protein